MSPYVHKSACRLRVRSDFIQEHPEQIAAAIEVMQQESSILEIKHKRYAGSVAITFDPQKIDADTLLERVRLLGWMRDSEHKGFIDQTLRSGSRNLVRGLVMVAIKRAVGAVI